MNTEIWFNSVMTSFGFFWKAAWAFVLGYGISAAIQAFVPRERLTAHMGYANFSSVGLATGFGALSSSCSFAALAAARTLLQKGAHFIAAVAFMFASTNLVIELGILIFIFLGWQFLAAELIGGLLLIAISSVIIRATYPQKWISSARDKLENEADADTGSVDWKKRMTSLEGWSMVGSQFFAEWGMVWREILVGFTLAGLVAVAVPNAVWEQIFLADLSRSNPDNFWLVLHNAAIAPFVAAATFIGSMGNIPLATVLNSGGVLFAGLMGFIYSDLMVPPLVKVNAKYYGWPVALYIAGVMYISIVMTAICLHYGFLWMDMMPESARSMSDVVRFKIDYTFFLNIAAVVVTAGMFWLKSQAGDEGGHDHDHGGPGLGGQDIAAGLAVVFLGGGLVVGLIAT